MKGSRRDCCGTKSKALAVLQNQHCPPRHFEVRSKLRMSPAARFDRAFGARRVERTADCGPELHHGLARMGVREGRECGGM